MERLPAAVDGDLGIRNTAYMVYVEFDDQGYLRQDKYKDQAFVRLQRIADEKPVLILVYAHGWKHNASVDDADVKEFRDFVDQVARDDHKACAVSEATGCARREVVGVYLGWRGLRLDAGPLTNVSFWERKSRAHRVGIDGATEVIAELGAIKAKSNERAEEGKGRSKLVLAGHSMGAALIYSATQQLLMRDTFFLSESGEIPSSTADLIVLVNPAFEAARFHALHQRAQKLPSNGHPFAASQQPILAIFSATSDEYTDSTFHLGRSLSTVMMPYAEYKNSAGSSASDQRSENSTAVGKFCPWITHELRLKKSDTTSAATESEVQSIACADLPTTPTSSSSLREDIRQWKSFSASRSDSWSLARVTMTRSVEVERTGEQHRNPYMIVRVDNGVICGHSGIWSSYFREFLYEFIAALNSPTDST